MIALIMALGSFGAVALVGIGILAWVLREHHLANKYRELAAEYQKHLKDNPPAQPTAVGGWVVVYTVGKKTMTANVHGSTEGEALLNFTRNGGARYDKIVSITR